MDAMQETLDKAVREETGIQAGTARSLLCVTRTPTDLCRWKDQRGHTLSCDTADTDQGRRRELVRRALSEDIKHKLKVNVIVSPFSCSGWAIGFVYLSIGSATPHKIPYRNNSTEEKHVEVITISNEYRNIFSQSIAKAHEKKKIGINIESKPLTFSCESPYGIRAINGHSPHLCKAETGPIHLEWDPQSRDMTLEAKSVVIFYPDYGKPTSCKTCNAQIGVFDVTEGGDQTAALFEDTVGVPVHET